MFESFLSSLYNIDVQSKEDSSEFGKENEHFQNQNNQNLIEDKNLINSQKDMKDNATNNTNGDLDVNSSTEKLFSPNSELNYQSLEIISPKKKNTNNKKYLEKKRNKDKNKSQEKKIYNEREKDKGQFINENKKKKNLKLKE